jgi:hypothetical protein
MQRIMEPSQLSSPSSIPLLSSAPESCRSIVQVSRPAENAERQRTLSRLRRHRRWGLHPEFEKSGVDSSLCGFLDSSFLTGRNVEHVQFRSACYVGEWIHDKNLKFVAQVEFQQTQLGVRYAMTESLYTHDCFEGCDTPGVPEGRGVMTYDSGNIYEGYFKDGMRHGRGKFYCARTREVISGIWNKGALVRSDGEDTAEHSDGMVPDSSAATRRSEKE